VTTQEQKIAARIVGCFGILFATAIAFFLIVGIVTSMLFIFENVRITIIDAGEK